MSDNVRANKNAIGVPELRQLRELADLNKMLVAEEFLAIANVYQKAIDRVIKEAEEQGVEI